jgi:hypothetical protein
MHPILVVSIVEAATIVVADDTKVGVEEDKEIVPRAAVEIYTLAITHQRLGAASPSLIVNASMNNVNNAVTRIMLMHPPLQFVSLELSLKYKWALIHQQRYNPSLLKGLQHKEVVRMKMQVQG